MVERIAVIEQILNANDQLALENQKSLQENHVFAINIMASPGAGKTSLILRTIEALSPRFRLAVVEGDTAPVTIDADKISGKGIPAVQVNTGGECHLDAVMLQAALPRFDLAQIDLMIVENVGNLICPANFRLGTHKNVLIASVPEGDDKPYKYPGVYRGVEALIINKIDLLPYVTFDMEYFQRGVEMLNPGLVTFPLSCQTGDGLEAWIEWLETQVNSMAGGI
jgi:hydrogenase nickel incorporation protein HypB